MTSDVNIYRASIATERLRQCEILSNLVQLIPHNDDPSIIDQIIRTNIIILSQDCDLHSDYDERLNKQSGEEFDETKLLPNLLLVELFAIRDIRERSSINCSVYGKIKTNQHERYQYLASIAEKEDLMKEGLSEMVCDFNYYISVPTDYVYLQFESDNLKRRSVIIPPYLEHLSSRFANHLSRVGLPIAHDKYRA